MPLRPLNDTLIIEPDPIERHKGVLVLPDKNSMEKISPFATVISCGSRCKYRFQPGQRIIYNCFFDKSNNIEVDGKPYRLILEHYVLAVIE